MTTDPTPTALQPAVPSATPDSYDAVAARIREAIAQMPLATADYQHELDRCDGWIKEYKDRDKDMYGVNFYEGRLSGIIYGNIVHSKAIGELEASRDSALQQVRELTEKNKQTAKDFETAFRLVRQEAEKLSAATRELAEKDAEIEQTQSALANTLQNIADTCRVRGFEAGPSGESTPDRVIALAQAYDEARAEVAGLTDKLLEASEAFTAYCSIGVLLDETQDDSPEERQPGIIAQGYAWEKLGKALGAQPEAGE